MGLFNGVDFILLKPSDALPIFPKALLRRLVFFITVVCAESVLLSFVPVSLVEAAVGPFVNSISLLLVAGELPVVPDLVCVLVQPVAIHVIFRPLTIELLSICPHLHAVSVDLVHPPLSLVH